MREKIDKVIKLAKSPFMKRVPVFCPILQGELLNGRVALITGGNSGIGLEIAKAFLNNGASVIIVGRSSDKNKRAVETLTKLSNGKSFVDQLTADFEEIEATTDTIKSYLYSSYPTHAIDILVNCAGVGIGEAIGQTSVKDYETVLKVNLEATYFISQTVYNYMKSKKKAGNILNILSSSSLRPATTPYNCSKWGEKGLTIGMAKKFIKDDIIVNAIAPGPTATNMLKIDPEKDSISLNNNPSRRYATPQEIANLAVVLTSNLGKLIVGDTIYATGGAGVITVDDIDY